MYVQDYVSGFLLYLQYFFDLLEYCLHNIFLLSTRQLPVL